MRWTEYLRDLYNDERENNDTFFNEDGPSMLREEIESAIKQTNKGKTPGPDNIVIEEIEAIGDFGVDILTKLMNDIYDTGYLPQDLKKSIFIPLPKKDGAVECEDHRTICIMSHVTKIFLRVILRRIRNKIKPEIAEVQCGFV